MRQRLTADPLLRSVWVVGEVSGYKAAPSGHSYFSLVEDQLNVACVVWKGTPLRGREVLAEGARVVLLGRTSIYDRRSTYQLDVREVQSVGLGARLLELEAAKERLRRDGLFDPTRKRPLPRFPTTVGIVTSRATAALQDVLTTLRRRWPHLEVLLAHAPVQGDEAPQHLVAALQRLIADGRCQVILLTRGGGSIDDLWAFNDEALARALAASPIPTVSAVGHEVDTTLCDLVADLRAPTPTAAAELVTPDGQEIAQRIADSRMALGAALDHRLRLLRERLVRAASSGALERPIERVHTLQQQVDLAITRSSAALQHKMTLARSRSSALGDQLRVLGPDDVLRRGYSITYDEDGLILRESDSVHPGARLRTRLSVGQVESVVTATKRDRRLQEAQER